MFSGLPIEQMLEKVAKSLSKATAGSQDNPLDLDDPDPMDVDSSDLEVEEDEDDDDLGYSDEDWAVDPQQPRRSNIMKPTSSHTQDRASTISLNQRIRRDLSYVKQAGFRVGHLGQLLNNGHDSFVTISCRIAKLGISDEALQAWHLDANLYYILVIRFTSGYRTYAELTQDESIYGDNGVHVRVGLSRRYKISLSEAIDAFSRTVDKSKNTNKTDEEAPDEANDGLAPFFISRTLNELLDEKLLILLRYRDKFALGWDGAEEYYHDNQGKSAELSDRLDPKYWTEDEFNDSLPMLVIADHLNDLKRDNGMAQEASFPLLAMQFALRHLVRCTEYCLVCHCRVRTDFEALKPYVCSKPLCLYQYMALGFGPSIEHEIIAQPHVVDLLVSFCYCSASTKGALKTFPVGMGLTVPSPNILPAVALQQGRYAYHPPHIDSPLESALNSSAGGGVVSHTARLDMVS